MFGLVKNAIKRVLPVPVWERFRNRWWRYVRPLTVDYCPVMLPWFPGAQPRDDASKLHRLAASFHWRNQRSLVTSAATVVAGFSWPFRFAYDSWRSWWKYGKAVARIYGVGRLRQLSQLLRLGVTANVPPLYYYRYRLFAPVNAALAASYLFPDEMSVLHPTLAAELPSNAPLGLKESFFEHGVQRGLPVAEVIALFADGRLHTWYRGEAERLPQRDLVLKPVDAACGHGFQLWAYLPAPDRWRRGERDLDADAFLQMCCDAAGHHRHILQKRLVNHPHLQSLSGRGLSTIRVVTYRRVSGQQGVLLACLRMPTGSSFVDNFEAGGIAAPIDLATGVLGAAVGKDPARGQFTHHPDSGAPIAGLLTPCFNEALATTLAAHAAFDWVPFVGWDVVITPDGPVLLEANPDWCVELAQIACGRPLGNTVFPEVYLEHLERQTGNAA